MKTYAIIAMALLVLSVMPIVLATDVGTGVGINVNTKQFTPKVWMCDNRVWTDDNVETQLGGVQRSNNYAFEGESISWKVLVMDKNKIEQITDVIGTLGPTQGAGNDVEVECKRVDVQPSKDSPLDLSCNARIDEEELKKFNPDTMAYYDCKLTVETSSSMHGEYFITVEAQDATGLSGTMNENEYLFLNPTIALSVDGDLSFEEVIPGTEAYSNTLLVGNDAEAGSGVQLVMFISGTDFYDPSSSGAACPTTNQLSLNQFKYYATNGAYKTSTVAGHDDEGYLPILHGNKLDQASEIMGSKTFSQALATGASAGNVLTPASEMALTFKLTMPEPCVGDFSEGQIYFWGEAI